MLTELNNTCICCLTKESTTKKYCPECAAYVRKNRRFTEKTIINDRRRALGILVPYSGRSYTTTKHKPLQACPVQCKTCWASSYDGVVCLFPRCIRKHGFKARRNEEWI